MFLLVWDFFVLLFSFRFVACFFNREKSIGVAAAERLLRNHCTQCGQDTQVVGERGENKSQKHAGEHTHTHTHTHTDGKERKGLKD